MPQASSKFSIHDIIGTHGHVLLLIHLSRLYLMENHVPQASSKFSIHDIATHYC